MFIILHCIFLYNVCIYVWMWHVNKPNFHGILDNKIILFYSILFYITPKNVLEVWLVKPMSHLYYKNCSDCSVSQSVSQSVRPSADISALKEISRNLGNHWCSQFLFSIFLRDLNIRISNCGKIFSDVHICELIRFDVWCIQSKFQNSRKEFRILED